MTKPPTTGQPFSKRLEKLRSGKSMTDRSKKKLANEMDKQIKSLIIEVKQLQSALRDCRKTKKEK